MKPSLIHWGSQPNFLFTAVILLTLLLDIGLVYVIYRVIASIFS